MTAVIAWVRKGCGAHAEGLSVDDFMALDNAHVCKPADVIRRAVAYFQARWEER